MTALSVAEMTAARRALDENRTVPPLVIRAALDEIRELRAAVHYLGTENGRLTVALEALRDNADTALSVDATPTPGNRTATGTAVR